MSWNLEWRGREAIQATEESIAEALEETAALCVQHAHPNTPIQYGTARGSLRFLPAQVRRGVITVIWGSFGVAYFIFLELGTRFYTGRHMMRNAAAENYPGIAERIRDRMRVNMRRRLRR